MSPSISTNFLFHKLANSIWNIASPDQCHFIVSQLPFDPIFNLFPHHLPVFPGLSLPRAKVFSHLRDLSYHFVVCQRWLLWPGLAALMSQRFPRLDRIKATPASGRSLPNPTLTAHPPCCLASEQWKKRRHH